MERRRIAISIEFIKQHQEDNRKEECCGVHNISDPFLNNLHGKKDKNRNQIPNTGLVKRLSEPSNDGGSEGEGFVGLGLSAATNVRRAKQGCQGCYCCCLLLSVIKWMTWDIYKSEKLVIEVLRS